MAAAVLELRERAARDPLTGLGHHATFHDTLPASAGRRRQGRAAAVLIADVDGFKDINDTRGHAAGDDVLRAMAGRCCAPPRRPAAARSASAATSSRSCSSATARPHAERDRLAAALAGARPARLDAVGRPRAGRATARPTRRSWPAPTRRSTRSSAAAATASCWRTASSLARRARTPRGSTVTRSSPPARISPSTLISAPSGSADLDDVTAARARRRAAARSSAARMPQARRARPAREPAGSDDDVEHAVVRLGLGDARAAAERAADRDDRLPARRPRTPPRRRRATVTASGRSRRGGAQRRRRRRRAGRAAA